MSLPPETESSNQMPWVAGTTRVFGVIAHPVDHVRAPMVFNPRFAAVGLPHIKHFIIDEDKIRLQIQENKKKPTTQNRFQRKMKEMMDKAEEQRKLQNRK